MALYRFFSREASRPHPADPLSDSVIPASIRDANEAGTGGLQFQINNIQLAILQNPL